MYFGKHVVEWLIRKLKSFLGKSLKLSSECLLINRSCGS